MGYVSLKKNQNACCSSLFELFSPLVLGIVEASKKLERVETDLFFESIIMLHFGSPS